MPDNTRVTLLVPDKYRIRRVPLIIINLNTTIMNETILQKMKQMKLHGMAGAFKTSLEDGGKVSMTTDEMISFLVESEWDDRNNRRIERRIRTARFRYKANVEQIDFKIDRNLDKNLMNRFAECSYIEKKENILITGSTGIGKSYIASALGNQACMQGYKVLYANTSKLFALLKMAKADGSYIKETARIEKTDLLILDDFGMQPLDGHNRSALIEIIEDRHGKRSTIITAQLPVGQWHDVIGEKTIADAVLDRIVHNAHRIEMSGESLRKRQQMFN
jgi:DNA replication protein DnaC